jgi:hypothetical protein
VNERLGIVEELQAARAKYGRFAYSAPVMERRKPRPAIPVIEPPVDPLKAAQTEIASLRTQNAHLRKKLGLSEAGPISSKIIAISEVQVRFCSELSAAGFKVEGKPLTVDDLKSHHRPRHLAWPRQVCVALVRDLCRWASMPMIGRAFGRRDHTTVHHAVTRAPEIMNANTVLREAHARTLAAFETAAE